MLKTNGAVPKITPTLYSNQATNAGDSWEGKAQAILRRLLTTYCNQE